MMGRERPASLLAESGVRNFLQARFFKTDLQLFYFFRA
jgi:hypothetical protein